MLVLFALGLTVFLGAAALTSDYGYWLQERRSMQNAADAAAHAGIAALLTRPINAAKRENAAEHAMKYLDEQLGLGLTAVGQVRQASTRALNDTDGFGAEDGTSYRGPDRFFIRTPVSSSDSCRSAAWGERAITVRVDHLSSRFFSRIFDSSDQRVGACATSAVIGGGLAVAVLKPNQTSPGVYATQPNNSTITMKLAGQESYVRIWGGDVGINSMFSAGANPPPNAPNDPAYVKFMTPNDSLSSDNHMFATVENPSPLTWSVVAKQIRAEGLTSATGDDPYHAPLHLPAYIPIPGWGNSLYAGLGDALAPTITMTSTTAPNGTCNDPVTGSLGVAPGKYDLIETGVSQRRWLCPGVFHLVPKNGQQGLQLGSNSTLAGQGVTLVFESGSEASISSGSALLLNSAAAGGTETPAAWRTGDSRHDVPITIWIRPVAGCDPLLPACSNPSSVFDMQGGSGMEIRGIIYGPTDEMKIAGNNGHHGSGEIWAWTLEYKGNSQLDQVYEGADDGYPLIVE